MKLPHILNHLGPRVHTDERPLNSQPLAHVLDGAEMQAKKVMSQFGTIARSYNLPLWANDEKWKYHRDFAVMLAHDDLKSIRLELLAQDSTVLFEFKIQFSGRREARLADHASGVELPLINRDAIAKHRIVMQRHGKVTRIAISLSSIGDPPKGWSGVPVTPFLLNMRAKSQAGASKPTSMFRRKCVSA